MYMCIIYTYTWGIIWYTTVIYPSDTWCVYYGL